MNDDHITQSVNDLVSQAGDQSKKQPTPNFGLGTNPSSLPRPQNDINPPNNDTGQDGANNDQALDDAMKAIGYNQDNQTPAGTLPQAQANDAGIGNPVGTIPAPQPAQNDLPAPVDRELETIRQQALSQLSPIVSKLDQSPEEKYRTLMMLIQASDDQTLISAAYDAANAITDETKKAEALLGIVNEINYFSKKNNSTN